jgi:nitroimidazol reductase NimA-like FMN-containing flavoprotein (pyridoxamine 5'-phosphate oxidase superfamily)
MRRSDKEIKDKTLLDEILQQAQVCRLAMSSNNIPYLVPLSFGYQEGCLYFHSAQEGKKINILKENPMVCFEVESMVEIKASAKACNWGVNYRSIIGEGEVTFIEEEKEKIKALNIIMQKYAGNQKFEFLPASLQEVTVFKLTINSLTGKKSGY